MICKEGEEVEGVEGNALGGERLVDREGLVSEGRDGLRVLDCCCDWDRIFETARAASWYSSPASIDLCG